MIFCLSMFPHPNQKHLVLRLMFVVSFCLLFQEINKFKNLELMLFCLSMHKPVFSNFDLDPKLLLTPMGVVAPVSRHMQHYAGSITHKKAYAKF